MPDPAAVVVTEVMFALGVRGYDVAITEKNGPELMRLGDLMLIQFGIKEESVADDHSAVG